MANKPILITGCQRSGTTLLNLILDSHPEIVGVDEMEFDANRFEDYVHREDYAPCVSFKLPVWSHAVGAFLHLDGLKVLWAIRDPGDVVLSMIKLKLNFDGQPVMWANHPLGGEREIKACAEALGYVKDNRIARDLAPYVQINRKHPVQRSREEALYAGALLWRLKAELLSRYEAEGTGIRAVRYESLVSRPRQELQEILDYLGLPWSDLLLQHHTLHSGHSVGNTVNTRPIDAGNTGKWRKELDAADLAIIRAQCGEIAARSGYDLGEKPEESETG